MILGYLISSQYLDFPMCLVNVFSKAPPTNPTLPRCAARLAAFGILVPPAGVEPGPSAVREWSPNRWTAREFPKAFHFIIILDLQKSCSNSAEFLNIVHPRSSDVNLLDNPATSQVIKAGELTSTIILLPNL